MRTGAAGLLIAALAAAACGSDDVKGTASVESDRSIPVAVEAQGPPGTALRDGFEVADGSVLVGAPIPTENGWYAVLYVDGNPAAVIDAYVDQGADQGLEPVEVPAGPPQFLIEGVPPERQQNTVCGAPAEGASGYRCESGAYTGGDHAPCLRLTLTRQDEGPSPTSALFIRYSTDDSLCVSAGKWVIGDPNAAVPTLSSPPPDLPSVGEPVDLGSPLGKVIVEDGSKVAAPVFPGLECGRSAILVVTEEPARVLDRYLDHLARLPNVTADPPTARTLDDGTKITTAVRMVPAGGDAWFFSMTEMPGHPTTLTISGCEG